MSLPANLSDLTASHLEQLVTTRATEGAHMDFKRQVPTNWDYDAKKRFIADVTAFANAAGGDLIFGVDEDDDAQAAAVVPQVFPSVDAEVRRLQDFMLNLVEPRLAGAQVQAVAVTADGMSGHALAVRIPQSWTGPHRSKVDSHFYVRDGLRNRQLDVPEIRTLFLRSESWSQRWRDFRSDRLGKVVTGETPVRLGTGPKLVVHAISTEAALGQAVVDPLAYTRGRRGLPYVGSLAPSQANLNFDGAFAPIPARGIPPGYTQQFRQGSFEAVLELTPFQVTEKPVLSGVMHEQYTNKFLEAVRAEFIAAGVAAEMAVFLSLIGADNTLLSGPGDFPGAATYQPFDRRDILLPDVLIPAEFTVGRGMRPAYDLMHQAAGYEGSPNYNDAGEWVGRI